MKSFCDVFVEAKFGRADVLAALSKCPQGHKDEWYELWARAACILFAQMRSDRLGDIIAENVEPMTEQGMSGSPATSLVTAFLKEGKRVWSVSLHETMIGLQSGCGHKYVVVGPGRCDEVKPEDVVLVLLRGKGTLNPEPHPFLLERLRAEVESVQRRAEEQLTLACAIDESGLPVVADRVIVVKDDGTCPTFSAEQFTENKIAIPRDRPCVDAYDKGDIRQAISRVRDGQAKAIFCRACGLGKNADDLIVHESLIATLPTTSGTVLLDVC
jgi:hypothetical protein